MKVTIQTHSGKKYVHLFEQGKSLPSMGVITDANTPPLAILMWVKEKLKNGNHESSKER